MSHKGFGGKTH